MIRRCALGLVALAAPLAAAAAPSVRAEAPQEVTVRNVAIIVHEGVELLDFAGPAEVFAAAAREGRHDGADAFNVYTVAPRRETITSFGVVRVEPAHSIDDCPPPDILVVPGGRTTVLMEDPSFMEWIARVAPDTEILMSVCTGALVYAEAGLLDGREATTHWSTIGFLRDRYPAVTVREGTRYVDTGPTVTTAGISAGIDGALHVVARLLGRAVADDVARYMEYEWDPVDTYVASYTDGDPRLDAFDNALRDLRRLDEAGRTAEAVVLARRLAAERPDEPEPWYRLGRLLFANGDPEASLEASTRAAASDDRGLRRRAAYNVAIALAQLRRDDEAVTALGRAVEAGFRDRGHAERDESFRRLRGREDFQALLRKMDQR